MSRPVTGCMNRPVTDACVATVHMLKMAGRDLATIAFTTGRSVSDIDRISWALIGRDIPDAVTALNRPRLVEQSA